MPIYEYQCRLCPTKVETRALDTPFHCSVPMRRLFSFAIRRSVPDHFNHALGKYVTGNRQLRDEFKRQSDDATERTGIVHQYEPVDFRDTEALGVTDEGLAASHDRAVAEGRKDPTGKKVWT